MLSRSSRVLLSPPPPPIPLPRRVESSDVLHLDEVAATFKTQFGGRTFPVRKGVFVKNFKAHNYGTSERDSSGCSNISLSTIGTFTTAL